jgi:hypothetical protein
LYSCSSRPSTMADNEDTATISEPGPSSPKLYYIKEARGTTLFARSNHH